MTPAEMTQITLDNWKKNFPKQIKNYPKEWLQKQAEACASLTRMEMNALKRVGVDEEQAWSEARSLFCMAPPPKYDRSEMES